MSDLLLLRTIQTLPACSTPMSSSIRIAAVFATMNRSQTAVACVLALARQTRPPEWVMVADNLSEDDTVDDLNHLENLPFTLIVHRMPENLGNAGGVKEMMESAFTVGADAVWILDDDSWPREEALDAMLGGNWNPHVIRHSLQVDPRTNRFTWPLWVQRGQSWDLAFEQSSLPEETSFPSKSSWTGALVSREVRQVVGPVNGDLFIRGEDEEYPYRIREAGFDFVAIRESVLNHPGPDDLVHWKLLGKNFFFERGLADLKLYYKVRNMVWLKRKHAGFTSALMMFVLFVLASILLDHQMRLPLICSAALRGWNGVLGRLDK